MTNGGGRYKLDKPGLKSSLGASDISIGRRRAGNLLTGFLKCGLCGANLVIVTGRKRRHAMYRCPQHFYRGACANDLRVRQRCLEERLLCDLQEAVLRPGAIDYTLEEFSRQVEAVRTKTSQEHAQADARRADLRQQLEHLTTAVAETGHSTFLLQAIAERERELAAVEHVLKAGAKDSHSDVEQLRRFAVEKLRELPELLSADVSRAQQNSHVT